MIIHDISKDTLTTPVYTGDPETKIETLASMENGDSYNLSAIHISAHTGTHIDAPKHFSEEGKAIDEMRLNTFTGKCTVISADRILTGEDMDELLPRCKRRILIHGEGNTFLSASAARVIADSKVVLVGIDASSIAAEYEVALTHRILCDAGVAILENLDLSDISDGEYEICAFPIKLGGLEAAPCRAILLEQERGI